MQKVISIEGMKCVHCAAAVEKALAALAGVETAKVNLEAKEATVTGTNLDEKTLSDSVSKAGYTVVSVK
ncbi:MAG: heavy-metal-associated domain-containing protein [Desulfovibrio sp.]|nr:heavy-metal-associated domain-containing protein [Desulfovibrio sp.]